jgi:endonuclease YncB( thermonuclease family)
MRAHHKTLIGGLSMILALVAAIMGLSDLSEALRPAPAADLFDCPAVYHHDGDAIRCGGKGRSARLYAIDAPEMPGSCHPGRQCTPGDPFASRDHLRALTAGRAVSCRQIDTDRYQRPVLQCFADGVDLSCAMVRDGFAVERYGRLRC